MGLDWQRSSLHPEALSACKVQDCGGCAKLYQSSKPLALVSRRKAKGSKKARAQKIAARQLIPVPLGLKPLTKQLQAPAISYFLSSVIWLMSTSLF